MLTSFAGFGDGIVQILSLLIAQGQETTVSDDTQARRRLASGLITLLRLDPPDNQRVIR